MRNDDARVGTRGRGGWESVRVLGERKMERKSITSLVRLLFSLISKIVK